MDTPLVSAVFPVHNGRRFVAAAVESVLAQTHPRVEVIVVDDGSTDDSLAVLDRFGSRLTVVRQANHGAAAALNVGFRLTRGAYVAFLDQDDLWDPLFLEQSVRCLAELDESVAGVVADCVRIDSAGRTLPGTQTALRGRFGLRDFLVQNLFPGGGVVLRHGAFLDAGGFDERLRATYDWDLWLRLCAAGRSLVALEHCLWRYRLHEANASGNPDLMRDDGLRMLARIYADPAVPAALRPWQARAVAYAHLHASTQLYAHGRDADGAADFAAAARAWPDLLHEDETHYATLCAEQPPGRKASPHGLDLERGAARLLAALAHGVSAAGCDRRDAQCAYARAYRALARLAYGQRDMPAVRRYAIRALQADVRLWSDWGTVGPAIKSLAGGTAIERLSRWKRRASG
jgi:glycosyltransferase involved in cell wall biosynthesis